MFVVNWLDNTGHAWNTLALGIKVDVSPGEVRNFSFLSVCLFLIYSQTHKPISITLCTNIPCRPSQRLMAYGSDLFYRFNMAAFDSVVWASTFIQIVTFLVDGHTSPVTMIREDCDNPYLPKCFDVLCQFQDGGCLHCSKHSCFCIRHKLLTEQLVIFYFFPLISITFNT